MGVGFVGLAGHAALAIVHQRTGRDGLILCDPLKRVDLGDEVLSTRVCRFVTCPACREKLKEFVEAVFEPLSEADRKDGK